MNIETRLNHIVLSHTVTSTSQTAHLKNSACYVSDRKQTYWYKSDQSKSKCRLAQVRPVRSGQVRDRARRVKLLRLRFVRGRQVGISQV